MTTWDAYAADRGLAEQHAALRAEKLSHRSEFLIFDENLNELGFVNDYLDVKFEASIDGTGGLQSTAPKGTVLAPELISHDPDRPMFATVQTASYRYSSVIKSTVPRKDSGSAMVIDIVGDPLLTRLDYISLRKDPSKTLQEQPTVAPIRSGNALTVVKELAAANVARLQTDPSWPIHVVPNYVTVDNSPHVVIESAMQPMGKAFLEALDGTGVVMMMWIWMPGDPVVPGGESFTRPTMVLDVVDVGTRSGWSTDVDDPIQQYYRVLSGGGFAAEWVPRSDPVSSAAYENGFPGQDPEDPWISWDLEGPGIESWSMPTVYATCPTAIWTGLRRGWLATVIGEIAADVTNTAITPNTDPPVLYDSVTDNERKTLMGALGSSEVVITGTNGEDLVAALSETRGYRYLAVSVANGSPFVFGYHFGLGDGQAFGSDSMGRFVDYVSRATYEDSPTVRCRWDLTVGDGKNDDPPVIKLLRRLRRNAELQQRYYTDTKAVIPDE